MVDCYRVAYGADIVEIVLFGSYTRGNYTEDSDIDIVALVHGSRETLQAKLKQVWDISAEIGLEHDVIVSPTVISYDDFYIATKAEAEEQIATAKELLELVQKYCNDKFNV